MKIADADPLDDWARGAHLLSGTDPRAYERRIVALALMGAVILHSVWVLAGVAAAVALALLWWSWWQLIPAVGFAWLAGAWLWMLFRPVTGPFGVQVTQKEAPALIALIAEVARELGAPTPTRVELIPDLNAMVQTRRRARGEWNLAIGLPLLLGTEVAQLKAIIGHELGHFVSGTPGARLVWSQQSGWDATLQMLQGSRLGGLVHRAFRTWGLRFQAEAVAMARNHERASDAAGGKVAGARATAEALVIIELADRALDERFWPEIWRQIVKGPPPEDVFVRMKHFLSALGREEQEGYYRSAIAAKTLTFDVHPCLSDRLAHLGEKPVMPRPIAVSAASLLGDQLGPLTLQLGRRWKTEVQYRWLQASEEWTEIERSLGKDSKRPPTELHPIDALKVGRGFRRQGRISESLPFYRRAVDLIKDDFKARLGLGLVLLWTGDASGLTELRAGVSLSEEDPEAVTAAFCAAHLFLEARGQPEKNPFTAAFHRLRLRTGRSRALRGWEHPSAF